MKTLFVLFTFFTASVCLADPILSSYNFLCSASVMKGGPLESTDLKYNQQQMKSEASLRGFTLGVQKSGVSDDSVHIWAMSPKKSYSYFRFKVAPGGEVDATFSEGNVEIAMSCYRIREK
jgi:hypothetical protein